MSLFASNDTVLGFHFSDVEQILGARPIMRNRFRVSGLTHAAITYHDAENE